MANSKQKQRRRLLGFITGSGTFPKSLRSTRCKSTKKWARFCLKGR